MASLPGLLGEGASTSQTSSAPSASVSQQAAQTRLMSQILWRPPSYNTMSFHAGGPYHQQQQSSKVNGGTSAPGAGLSTSPTQMASDEFQETKSITLEWRLSNLKAVFDSSRGDAKSKCIKSPLFGDGKWEIFFYGNAGGGGDFCSLYLSAEPTLEERERGLKFAARSRGSQHAAVLLAKSSSNPALAALATAAAGHQSHQQGPPQHQQQTSPGGQAAAVAAAAAAHGAANSPATPWIREGSFRFAFEIRSPNKKEPAIKTMEAADHVFSSEARNWGWQSFVRRSDVFYNHMAVRSANTFVIACTITHTPSKPTPVPNALSLKRLMPLELVNAFAGMFNDPMYSDVRFVIESRSQTTGKKKERHLHAIRKILSSRAEYFHTMFSSGFSEDGAPSSDRSPSRSSSHRRSGSSISGAGRNIRPDADSDLSSVDSDDVMLMYESDSDEDEDDDLFDEAEDDADAMKEGDGAETTAEGSGAALTNSAAALDADSDDGEEDEGESHTAHTTMNDTSDSNDTLGNTAGCASPTSASAPGASDDMKVDISPVTAASNAFGSLSTTSPSGRRYPTRRSMHESGDNSMHLASDLAGTTTMRSVSTNLRPSLMTATSSTTITSPRAQRYQKRAEAKSHTPSNAKSGQKEAQTQKHKDGRSIATVVVKDASYTTYKALLYYLYTDTITFAPLSSVYAHSKDTADFLGKPFPYNSRSKFFEAYAAAILGPHSPYHARPKDLICSSKAIYKLADKLNIPELKNRAFEHIVQSLTIETIPYEVFSAFSDQFPEVRKVQVDMMLHYWNDVREGQAMKNVLRLIRQDPDRFPGYEEVWQHLLLNLEYRAHAQPKEPAL